MRDDLLYSERSLSEMQDRGGELDELMEWVTLPHWLCHDAHVLRRFHGSC